VFKVKLCAMWAIIGFRTQTVNDIVLGFWLELAIFEGWMKMHLPGVVRKVKRPRCIVSVSWYI